MMHFAAVCLNDVTRHAYLDIHWLRFSSAVVPGLHPTRTAVLGRRCTFVPQWQMAADECDAKATEVCAKTSKHSTQSSKPLILLRLGTKVVVQGPQTKRQGTTSVVNGVGHRPDYHIELPLGRVYWRNLCFLLLYVPRCSNMDVEGEESSICRSTDKPYPPKPGRFDLPLRHSSHERPAPTCGLIYNSIYL